MLVESLEGRSLLASVPLEFFDAVTVPNLPTNWTAVHTGAGAPWATVSGGSHTPNNHAFISNPATTSEGILTSPLFVPTPATMQISFRNSYNTELNADGGVLEISIGANPGFIDILAAGGSFITGGYNSTLGAGGALNGRQAWSGNSNGYILTTIQLPSSALGQTVRVQGRFASNGSNGGVGWRIDTVSTESSNAPIIGSIGATASYTENSPRVLVFPTATITDSDTVNFASAALTVSNTNAQAFDTLAIVPNASITVSGTNVAFFGTNIGTFTGGVGTTPMVFNFNNQALIARVQLVLNAIGFANSSEAPTTTARNVSVQITDGNGGISALQTKQVSVISVNDAPVLTLPTAAVTYFENASPLAIFAGAPITDVDTPILSGGVLTITNTNGEATDRLTIASSSFVTVINNSIFVGLQSIGTFTGGTGTTPLVVTFNSQGALNRVVAVLSLIRFSNASELPSNVSRIVSVRLTDGAGGTSTVVNRTVGVTPINDAPVVTLPTAAVTYVENAAALPIFSGATITDADTPVFSGGVLTVTNTNGDANDRLAIVPNAFVTISGSSILVSGQSIGTFTGGFGVTPFVVTFNSQASLNRVVAVLGLIRFSNISDAPSGVSRIVSVRVTDGAGGTSVIVNRTVGVTPVNDAPVITLPTAPVTYVENAAALPVFSGATITDADTPVFNGGVMTVTITNGDANDRLAIVPNAFVTISGSSILVSGQSIGTFTGGLGVTPFVVTFNSQASLNRVVAVLGLIRFSNVSNTPSGVSRIISVRVTDGAGGTSVIVNRTIGVTPVNDAPVVGGISGSTTYVRNAAPIVVAGSATVSDADGAGFGGGRLSVSATLGGSAVNRIELGGSYSINASNQVLFGAVVIGTVTSNGVGLNALSITFASTATVADVQGVARSVRFRTVGATVASSVTIGFTVFDPLNASSGIVSTVVNVT